MPQSANFSVQNALKLTYKHPEIKTIFTLAISLAIKGGKEKGGEGTGGEGRGREGEDPDPQVF
jgi:hypothetical protein